MSEKKRGQAMLFDALTTKGTAFSDAERREFGLLGLLPTAVKTLEEQAEHCWHEFSTRREGLDQHIYLRALQDRNETLFYRVMREHIPETLPIIYTPTVGEACQRFSEIYRRPRGLFVSYADRDCLDEVLGNRLHHEVDVIVVTDGQRILGLGDQGIGGMGIPIGKLSLYTLIGGIDPARTLPIVLDVGTDNVELLDDPQYLGWRHRRIDDDEYYAFIDKFVAAVHKALPNVLLQWEDFATTHAQPILTRYRDKLLTFNDDIQGTAAVTLGALHGAAKVAGRPLAQQQVVMLGAGSAGIGVLDMIRREMVTEGLSEQQARERIWVVDVVGLLTDDRTDLSEGQRDFAQPADRVADWGLSGPAQLADVVHHVDVGVLLGLSTAAGAFTEEIVREMAGKTQRPIIFPLSNPTSRAEAHPAELDAWTDGRALVATGSPFAPVRRNGVERPIAQCNNVYIFPAMGLAVTAAQATRVTDEMMRVAAATLGEASPALADPDQPLLPTWSDVPDVAMHIAHAVAVQASADGVAPKRTDEELTRRIEQVHWTPEYWQGDRRPELEGYV
jgi:malate dehydrogenase (oxaloacetate-decarboxylating)